MCEGRFLESLNKIFHLMKGNKLREDIDDTLLEKLLTIIETNISDKYFINDLLKNTEALLFCEDVLLSIFTKENQLSSSIVVFTLRLLGLIFEDQIIFISKKNTSLCLTLSQVIYNDAFTVESPSTQDAFLKFFMSIAKHQEGALWIIELKLVDFILTSFSSTSYYVKKSAVQFFTTTLQLWRTPEFSGLLQSSQKAMLNDTFENIISKLISLIQFPMDEFSDNNKGYIMVLKQLYESKIDKLNCSFKLLEIITKYFEQLNKEDPFHQDIIDLLFAILHRDISSVPVESILKKIMQILVARKLFSTAFCVASSFLKSFDNYKPLPSHILHFFLMPLNILSKKLHSQKDEDIFGVLTDTTFLSLAEEMSTKSKATAIICASLRSITNLTSFMTTEAIKTLLSLLKFIFQSYPDQFSSNVWLENKFICLCLFELFASFHTKETYAVLDVKSKQMLYEYLINFLQKPSTLTNMVSQALLLLKSAIALGAELEIVFNTILSQEELIKVLCRKLLDSKEPIVDSALHLAGEMMNGKGKDYWRQSVQNDNVHIIIWDIAMEGCHDGMIKATALKVIIEACLQTCYLNDVKSTKHIDEADIMTVLCNYVQDPDFFMQREAASCACGWMKAKQDILPHSCKMNLFVILSMAVRSLDLEMKLIGLDQWKWCFENSSFFPEISKSNIHNCFNLYCSSGLAASLIYAIEDYDDAAKYKAAKILLSVREKLIQEGFHLNFELFNKNETKNATVSTEIPIDSLIINITEEERNEGINSVMNLSTAQQLLNICKTISDGSFNYTNSVGSEEDIMSCPVSSFWGMLWSNKLNDIVSTEEVSTSVLSDYSLSVLDDIIAAERTDMSKSIDEIPDCY